MENNVETPVDLVRRTITALNRGDIEAALECCADDIVVWAPGDLVSGQKIEGKNALRRVLELSEATWPDLWTSVNAIVNNDHLVAVEMTAVARENGRAISQPMAAFYWVENGVIVEQRSYYDLGALERLMGE